MKIAARITLGIMLFYFVVFGMMQEDGMWKLFAALTLFCGFLVFLLILVVTAFPQIKK